MNLDYSSHINRRPFTQALRRFLLLSLFGDDGVTSFRPRITHKEIYGTAVTSSVFAAQHAINQILGPRRKNAIKIISLDTVCSHEKAGQNCGDYSGNRLFAGWSDH